MNILKKMTLRRLFLLIASMFIAGLVGLKLITFYVVDSISDEQRQLAQSSSELLHGFEQLRYILSDIERSAYFGTLIENEEMLITTAAHVESFHALHKKLYALAGEEHELQYLQDEIGELDEDYKKLALLIFAMSAQYIENVETAHFTLEKLEEATLAFKEKLDATIGHLQRHATYANLQADRYERYESVINLLEMFLIVMIFLLVMYLMQRTLFLPLYRLVDFLSDTAASGNLKARFAYNRQNEIGQVSLYLNKLLETLETSTVTNTELEKRVQSELKKSRDKDHILYTQAKHAQMGEMFNMIAHQWRQPLQSISASTGHIIVKKTLGTLGDEDIENHTKLVNMLTQELSKTINDFMAFTKPQKEKQNFDFGGLITELSTFMGAQLRALEVELSDQSKEAIELSTHRQELLHVLLNLISNAKDALESSGTVMKKITLEAKKSPDGRVIISVHDNGGGIPTTIIDRIFTPYFTTKEQGKGTGIGLYMSKRIVEEVLGGTLDVRNEDNGALFTVTL